MAVTGGGEPLGNGELNLPYEESPPGQTIPAGDTQLASGLVVLACTVAHPTQRRHVAGLMYRFAKPDGSGFYQPILLLAGDDELFMLNKLTRDAVAGAVRERKRRDGL